MVKILGIETSCDDTCVALIEVRRKKRTRFNILSNIISSQIKIHKKWGGVYPTLAAREHQKNLVPVFKKALKRAGMLKSINAKTQISKIARKNFEKIFKKEPDLLNNFIHLAPKIKKQKIEAIAVTIGPGLEPCLWAGINFAKALSYFWNIPLIPVNHIEAHISANFLNPSFKQQDFPAICLVVSGGHTQIVLAKNYGKYKVVGETRDDAAGECLDKIARIIGLGYPGGPIIEKKASQWKSQILTTNKKIEVKLPRPMIHSKDYDFSFSGLKTAVLYDFKKRIPKVRKSENYIQQICFESQQSVIDVLIRKTIKAGKDYGVKTILLGGGVVTNKELRKQFKNACLKPGFKQFAPPQKLCTDNAVMIAVTSLFHYSKKTNWKKIKAKANLKLDK